MSYFFLITDGTNKSGPLSASGLFFTVVVSDALTTLMKTQTQNTKDAYALVSLVSKKLKIQQMVFNENETENDQFIVFDLNIAGAVWYTTDVDLGCHTKLLPFIHTMITGSKILKVEPVQFFNTWGHTPGWNTLATLPPR